MSRQRWQRSVQLPHGPGCYQNTKFEVVMIFVLGKCALISRLRDVYTARGVCVMLSTILSVLGTSVYPVVSKSKTLGKSLSKVEDSSTGKSPQPPF